MKEFLTMLCLLISPLVTTVFAQNESYILEKQAKEAFDVKEYEEAINLFEDLISKYKTSRYVDEWKYAIARSYVQLNKKNAALDVLGELNKNEGVSYSQLMLDTALIRLRKEARFTDITKSLHVDSILYVYDIVMDMVNSPDSIITYEGKTVRGDWNRAYLEYYGENDSMTFLPYFDKELIFNNCNISSLQKIGLKGLKIRNNICDKGFRFFLVYIKNSLEASFNNPNNPEIVESLIEACKFGSLEIFSNLNHNNFKMKLVTIGSDLVNNSLIKLHGANISISQNKFKGKENVVELMIKSDKFEFKNNEVEGILDIDNLSISNLVSFRDNEIIGRISCSETVLSEFSNDIDWKQLAGNKLMVIEDIPGEWNYETGLECQNCFRYYGIDSIYLKFEIDSVLKEEYKEWAHKNLINSYYKLNKIYKDRGDLESANSCYAEMKDVMGRRLKAIYNRDGGFQNYIQWKLNRLLKTYTNHGTNLALPIVISIYVILAFSVFYFFFPSDWDVSSKSKLLHDFKEFKTKNDKGYFKPFLILISGLFVSLINALTLSLNAFVTLGFGAIPTKGLARYVCIIQGFIGWFLLSIFTVTLINQVLF
ncbi:MAG: hypothetical protein OEX22_09255 [Cyclobacteriaceae bacterium]|nr:hypothetical protein [Cyclobacteriaceae bacterium]